MKKILFILLLLVLIFSCNLKFLYNQLDTLIPSLLNKYLTLDGKQYSILEDHVVEILKWHRVTQLPLYAESLRTFVREVETGKSEVALEYIFSVFANFRQDLIEQAVPDMMDILSMLHEDQVTHLVSKIDEENKKYKSKFVDPLPDELIRNQINDMKKQLFRLLGSITPEQEEFIKEWAGKLFRINGETYMIRLELSRRFSHIMALRDDRITFSTIFHEFVEKVRNWGSKGYNAKNKYNEFMGRELFASVGKILTGEQRKELIKKALSFADDFEDLAIQ